MVPGSKMIESGYRKVKQSDQMGEWNKLAYDWAQISCYLVANLACRHPAKPLAHPF